jgi:cytochrome c biogenesis protein CcmG/thiol:disulfide interchange protein DsbE
MSLSKQGANVFGVNYKDSPTKANLFLQELGDPFTMSGADPDASMGLDWGVYGLPETFVISPDGKVLLRVAGPLTQRNMKTRVLPALKAAGISFP